MFDYRLDSWYSRQLERINKMPIVGSTSNMTDYYPAMVYQKITKNQAPVRRRQALADNGCCGKEEDV